MKYPYIGKANLDGALVVFYSECYGRCFYSDNWGKGVRRDYNEQAFTNTTREYLEGKCVKTESPEHSEFVQKLAFNAGFKWSTSFGSVKHTDKKLLIFKSSGSINFGNCADYDDIQITIPLPPKEEPEPKEWPQVGDDVVICDKSNLEELFRFKGKSCKVIGIAYYEGVKVLTVANKQQGIAAFNMGEWIKKPKTEAEILRDDLIDLIMRARDAEVSDKIIANSILSKYNIIKKPQ